ncbi:MAG: cation-transporting P-type ATPase [Thiotrichales bacterium]|nr:cation-transporting P-type ATPase [Thiotrichales bacterium]
MSIHPPPSDNTHTTAQSNPPAWHYLSSAQTLEQLCSSEDGLSSQTVAHLQQTLGPNRLPAPDKPHPFLRFVRHFHNLLIYVLFTAAAVTAFLGHWMDTIVILSVVIVNTLISFFQEGKAQKSLDAIAHLLAPNANVIRQGQRQSIAADNLVPGDLVLLEAGDKVPADLRLLRAHQLSIQEAMLTGESLPVVKDSQPVARQAALGDRRSMAFSGTMVIAGQGLGVVVAIGKHTEIGRISNLLAEVQSLRTPLVQQMDRFAKWLMLVILSIGALLVAHGYWVTGENFNQLFIAVVGLSVAAIPEGMPAVLTITLAIGVQTMARRHAIVRHLPAIETLGSVSVICTDKTGTLTRNEMMVASVLTAERKLEVQGEGYAPEGPVLWQNTPLDLKALLALKPLAHIAILCNDAHLHEQAGVWQIQGDPMEGALLSFAGKIGLSLTEERKNWPRTDVIPFDAKHQFMATLHHDHQQHAAILVKGAPEKILKMCVAQMHEDGNRAPLQNAYWQAQASAIAAEGQRVLAFALLPVASEKTVLELSDLEGKLTLVGMLGLLDPPRPEAITAVAECQQAGIRVKMITGDHRQTAAAIAEQIGLKNPQSVLIGTQIDQLSDLQLQQKVVECDVFARTSPEHKLRLVKALQTQKLSVAMTGDGVNDAPALKRANAGIAMGRKGSEAAKEAADFVLMDDNFATLSAAVKEGRRVYDNLKKVIAFMLPINGGEASSLIIALLIGLTLPIAPTQLLWVNMIGSAILGMTLAFEAAEDSIMQKPPRAIDAPILDRFVLWRVLFVSALFAAGIFAQFYLALAMGKELEIARTMAVNTLLAMEVFYLFSIRFGYTRSLTWRGLLGTKPILIALSLVVTAQLLFVYAPFMQRFFQTQALSLLEWGMIFSAGLMLFLIVEIEKWIGRELKTKKAKISLDI